MRGPNRKLSRAGTAAGSAQSPACSPAREVQAPSFLTNSPKPTAPGLHVALCIDSLRSPLSDSLSCPDPLPAQTLNICINDTKFPKLQTVVTMTQLFFATTPLIRGQHFSELISETGAHHHEPTEGKQPFTNPSHMNIGVQFISRLLETMLLVLKGGELRPFRKKTKGPHSQSLISRNFLNVPETQEFLGKGTLLPFIPKGI